VQSNNPASITTLPRADADALAHSQALQQVIRAEIAANDGHISFARFMQMALYEPGLGYYSAGARKFGEGGDFVTAPEISSLFSICLARQCAESLREMEQPVILELGAGTGVMACDVLQELHRLDCLPEKYYILETSADLRQRQQLLLEERLPELISRVQWLDTLPTEPLTGVILANEVLDAIPVQRFCLQKGEVREMHVGWQEEGFVWQQFAADVELEQKVKTIMEHSSAEFTDGYTSEINPDLEAWIKSLADCLQQGLMLFIDYGYSRHEYYHEQRTQGTLLCHYRQRAHDDPFFYVGLQDITASVDFTAVAEAAVSAELRVSGFTSQAYFLIACGLEQIMLEQEDMNDKQRLELSRQIKLLTMPNEMGERFKVIALTRNIETALTGFSLVDHRRRL
jgi:SAM-dependent MidA family methyltransferase